MDPVTNADPNETLSTVTPPEPATPEPTAPEESAPAPVISPPEPTAPPDPIAPPEPETPPEPVAPAEPAEPPAPEAPADPFAAPAAPVVGGSDPAAPVVGGMDPASPAVGGGPADPTAPGAAVPPASSPKSGLIKGILLGLSAVVIVGGLSAAAYFGYVLPNKPINVLKMSLANTLQQPQSTYKGSLESNASSGGVAVKADFSGATDAAAKAADIQLNLTVSGVNFPIEARLVNKNVYVKAGDLKNIASLVGAYSPSAAGLATTLSSELSNKWIVFDSTLINESGMGCYLDASWGLSNADINLLNKAYDKNPFAIIKSTASDTVNGKKAEKFVLNIDNDKIAAFGNDKNLDNLSLAKATKKCSKSATPASDLKGDHKQTPLTVWVDKGKKRIVKIAYDNKDGTASVTMDYNKVAIPAPANAEPAMQVLAEIQKAAASDPGLANLLGGATTAQ